MDRFDSTPMLHGTPPLFQTPLSLHVFHSFGCGGAQTRFVQLANHFGSRMRHVVIAENGDYSSMSRLAPHASVETYPRQMLRGPFLRKLSERAAALSAVDPDCLVTHNWGTIEWTLARAGHRVRHVHIEDGFGPDEAEHLKQRRVLARRLLLQRSHVVVPSETLRRIAQRRWNIGAERLLYIPNGIDCARFAQASFARRERPRGNEPPMFGIMAALRPEKNVARLLRAFALAHRERPCRLMIVGDGPERHRLESLARELHLSDAIRFSGYVTDPVPFYAAFDIFVLTSDTEQMPYTVLEAMAAGLPVVATDVGDIRSMLSEENASLIVSRDDQAVTRALLQAIDDRSLAQRAGEANERRARSRFDQSAMFAAFAGLYGLAPMSGQSSAGG